MKSASSESSKRQKNKFVQLSVTICKSAQCASSKRQNKFVHVMSPAAEQAVWLQPPQ